MKQDYLQIRVLEVAPQVYACGPLFESDLSLLAKQGEQETYLPGDAHWNEAGHLAVPTARRRGSRRQRRSRKQLQSTVSNARIFLSSTRARCLRKRRRNLRRRPQASIGP